MVAVAPIFRPSHPARKSCPSAKASRAGLPAWPERPKGYREFGVPASVWQKGAIREMGDPAFQVLIRYAEHFGNNPNAWPGIEHLSEACGLAEITVKRAVRKLIELGWIVPDGRHGRVRQFKRGPRWWGLKPSEGSPPTPQQGSARVTSEVSPQVTSEGSGRIPQGQSDLIYINPPKNPPKNGRGVEEQRKAEENPQANAANAAAGEGEWTSGSGDEASVAPASGQSPRPGDYEPVRNEVNDEVRNEVRDEAGDEELRAYAARLGVGFEKLSTLAGEHGVKCVLSACREAEKKGSELRHPGGWIAWRVPQLAAQQARDSEGRTKRHQHIDAQRQQRGQENFFDAQQRLADLSEFDAIPAGEVERYRVGALQALPPFTAEKLKEAVPRESEFLRGLILEQHRKDKAEAKEKE